jgi:hypothetical protein
MNIMKENIIFLQAVGSLHDVQVKELLKTADRNQITAIAEVFKNVLGGVIRIPTEYKIKLTKDRGTIRSIADNKVSHEERLETLVTSSDIVSLLIKAVLKRLLALAK